MHSIIDFVEECFRLLGRSSNAVTSLLGRSRIILFKFPGRKKVLGGLLANLERKIGKKKVDGKNI